MLRTFANLAFQFSLILAIICALAYLSAPLMQLGASVVTDSRIYNVDESTSQPASTLEQAAASDILSDKARVQQVTNQLPYMVFALAILGWMSLQLVARKQSSVASLLIASAISALAGAAIQAYGISSLNWLIASGAFCIAGAFMAYLERRSMQATRVAIDPSTPDRTKFVTWVWGIWVLLTFIGLFWLMDISARGPSKLMYVGLHQLDALWLAGLVIMPAMAWLQPKAMHWLLTLRQAWNTPRGPWILISAMVFLIALAVWLGRYAQYGAQRGYPHMTAELVRLLTGLSFAWILSRYGEWGGTRSRSIKAGIILAFLLGIAILTLLLTEDLGPVLAISVALVPGVLMVISSQKVGRKFAISLAAVCVAWMAVLWTMRFALVDWLPKQDWVPQRFADRLEAMQTPFAAYLDYGSQIRWLWDAAGPNGFGLGGVPWCGAGAQVHLSECTPYSGVPVQFASDYVFSATVALWGPWIAVALVAATAIYFIAIGAAGMGAALAESGSKRAMNLLHRWICLVFAALAIGQLLVSVAGNSFFIPLSGVTQPLLGLGSTSVIALAAWIGFAVGGYYVAPQTSAPVDLVLKQWIGRYAVAMAAGVAVIVAGMLVWSTLGHSKVQDRLVSERLERGLNVLACALLGEHQLWHCALVQRRFLQSGSKSSSEHCQTIGVNVDQAIALWQVTNGTPAQRIDLSCEQAASALLALRWAKARPKMVVQRLLNARPEEIQAAIAITNPYRLAGCIYLDGPVRKVAHPSDKKQTLCSGGYTNVRTAIAHTTVLGQTLAAYTSKVRSQSTSLASSNHIFHPEQQDLSRLTPPMWAQRFGLDSVLLPLIEATSPAETTLGQGKSLHLSVQGVAQHAAQAVNDCYTGKGCSDTPLLNPAGRQMLESARARMAGTLVVNAKNGVIEAAASAYTHCYQVHYSGVKDVNCITLPETAQARDWMLTNRALYANAMVGSLTKVPMALGLIRTRSPLTQSDASLDTALSQSETEKFIDDALCADQAFSATCINRRVAALIDAGHTLGWSSTCKADQKGCGYINLLASIAGITHSVPAARWMTDPHNAQKTLLDQYSPGGKEFETDYTAACHAKNSPNRWRHCTGQGLVATVAELFGQGNATSTPVGIATGMLNLVQLAKQGTSAVALTPVLAARASRDAGVHNTLSRSDDTLAANRILAALSKTVQPGGTAHLACLRALAQARTTEMDAPLVKAPTLRDIKTAPIDCGQGGSSQWIIASKTGTPLFPHDQYTYRQRLQHCSTVAAMHEGPAKQYEWIRCQVTPVKWFVAVLGKKDGNKIDWQKIIVVITERNWNAKTGRVDTPLDRGGNVAAEIGLATARALIR